MGERIDVSQERGLFLTFLKKLKKIYKAFSPTDDHFST
jgi:hypothetical protein